MDPRLSPEQYEAVVASIRGGSKIMAVKQYREATGLGLAESKDAVERISDQIGFEWTASLPQSQGPRVSPAPQPSGLTPAKRAAVIEAMTRGNKIEAIKIYREATGLGLAESKDAVEAMERSIRAEPTPQPSAGLTGETRTPLPAWDPNAEKKKSGCLGLIALLGGLVWVALEAW